VDLFFEPRIAVCEQTAVADSRVRGLVHRITSWSCGVAGPAPTVLARLASGFPVIVASVGSGTRAAEIAFQKAVRTTGPWNPNDGRHRGS
jgi:hypothetical protein